MYRKKPLSQFGLTIAFGCWTNFCNFKNLFKKFDRIQLKVDTQVTNIRICTVHADAYQKKI